MRIQRPWLPKVVPFETGRVTERWAGYQTPRWRKLSRWFKSNNPLCSVPGCNNATYYTDHVIPALECADPWDTSNMQPLCKRHGASKTGSEGAAKSRGEGASNIYGKPR